MGMHGRGPTAAVLLAFFTLSAFPRDLPGQPPASGEPQVESGEAGLSKKEIRQRRRAERRARRRADREAGDESEGEDDAEDAAEERKEKAQEAGRARAVSKAAGMAESLKDGFGAGLESAAAMSAGGSGVPGGLPGGAPGAVAPREIQGGSGVGARDHPVTATTAIPGAVAVTFPGGDPARPKGMPDYLLAARSGYAPALGKAGLRLSPDGRSLVRVSDGRPAEAEDLSRLKAAIEAMPAALALRPDFFSHISPEHFEAVKAGFHGQPELADSVYRHVAPTEENRDLVHSQSCSKISGGCNENVRRPSYKKGEFVSPEDLERMWGALDKELEEDGEREGGVARLAGPRAVGRRFASGGAPPSTEDEGAIPGKAAGETGHASHSGAAIVSTAGDKGNSLFSLFFDPASPVGGASPGGRRRSWTSLVVGLAFAVGIALAVYLRKRTPPDMGE